ncbi:hypothetical protein [Nostoc sp.]|uniref:hypothetical protein n=1 Tax=Nostoc sp. TaxID=1180 RepID=UPI002FF4400B
MKNFRLISHKVNTLVTHSYIHLSDPIDKTIHRTESRSPLAALKPIASLFTKSEFKFLLNVKILSDYKLYRSEYCNQLMSKISRAQ